MAIYHLSGTVISRSQGRSAIACAAYRSGERLHDERQDKTHDYSRKGDVIHKEIMLPENAPSWMSDRGKLWNAVESAEKRKDSQIAREFHFSLPCELSNEQNIQLTREFVQNEFVSKGMVADLAFHNHKNRDGQEQPHVHVMLTMREVTPEGFGKKVREWNAKEYLLQWRESWAEHANKHLFLNGYDIKIDHRTLEAQGIDLEPQHRIGPAAAKERMARFEDHQRIARENGEKLLAEPEIALTGITRQQSTFTKQDMARFVHRHTVDAEQFQAVYDKVITSKELVFLGVDQNDRERFTTKEILAIETQMSERADKLVNRDHHAVGRLVKAQASATRTLSPEQQMAFEHLVEKGDLKSVVGYAGSGKSYLLGAAREAWEAQGYTVHGVALSGIAAENLEAGSGIPSRTIASRTYFWDKGEEHLTSKDILVVDEAGMIGSGQLNRLIGEAEQNKAKIVLIGDPYQLQAIEAGAAFRAITERSPTVTLTEIRRQQIPWQKEATVELATGKTEEALNRYTQHDHVHAFETSAVAKQGLVELWNDVRLNDPDKTQIMLTFKRVDVKELNEIARNLRRESGELGFDHPINTAKGERIFAERERVYFLENDRDMGVKNGTLGTIEKIDGNVLKVRLDKLDPKTSQAKTITFSTDRYNKLDHGYAATIHKSQGVTVDRAYVLASKNMDGHATYVALSRHRESVDLFYGKDEFAHPHALANTLGRERSKDISLDYTDPSGFASQRGFEKAETPSEMPTNQQQSYEKLLQEARKEHSRLNKNSDMSSHRDFREFYKTQFESEHTEFAKESSKKNLLRDATKSNFQLPDSLREFKKQFEANNPEVAKKLQEEIRSRLDRHKFGENANKIDWKSPRYRDEWDSLRKNEDRSIQIMVGFYDLLSDNKTPRKIDSIEKSLEDMAMKISERSPVKESAPKLIEAIKNLAKTREKERSPAKDKGIDMDIDF